MRGRPRVSAVVDLAEGAPAGLLSVTAAPAWSFLPDAPLRGPPREPGHPSGRIPGAPGPAPCGARPSGERAPRGHRSGTGTKEPPGRHARAHTWPLAPTRAPRRRSALRQRLLARPPGLQLRPLPTGPRSPAQRRGGHGDARGLRGPTAALPSRAPLRGSPPCRGLSDPGRRARGGCAGRKRPQSGTGPSTRSGRRKPRGPASLEGQVPGSRAAPARAPRAHAAACSAADAGRGGSRAHPWGLVCDPGPCARQFPGPVRRRPPHLEPGRERTLKPQRGWVQPSRHPPALLEALSAP